MLRSSFLRIALKTEKVWGDKFENTLLQSMQSVDSYAPVWYYGAAMRPRSFTNNLQSRSPAIFNKVQSLPKALEAVIGAVVHLVEALLVAEVAEEAWEGGEQR